MLSVLNGLGLEVRVIPCMYAPHAHAHKHWKAYLVVELKQLLVAELNKDIFLNLERETERDTQRDGYG